MGPGKYDPNLNLTTKNFPKTRIVNRPFKPNNIKAKIEKLMNKVVEQGSVDLRQIEDLDLGTNRTYDYEQTLDMRSIQGKVMKQAKKGINAAFGKIVEGLYSIYYE